jgi:anti-sigma factor RsiW
MSFNSNDRNSLKISRTNYEEFFLLYVDDELSEEQKLEVEQFVALHPDVAAELEMLITTKLPARLLK